MQKRILYTFINMSLAVIIIVMALKLQSCSKKYDVDYTSNLSIPHCADGVRDYDETGVDCGGKDCIPCETKIDTSTVPPCNATLNVIQLTDLFGANTNYNVSTNSSTLSNNNYTVKCSVNSNTYLFLQFPSKPTVNAKYTILSTLSGSSVPTGQVYTYYYSAGDNLSSFDGDTIKVQIVKGKINVYVCDENYTSFNTAASYDITVRAQ